MPIHLPDDLCESDRRSVVELDDELLRYGESEEEQSEPPAHLADLLLERFRISGKPNLEILCNLIGLRIREKTFRAFDGILIRGESGDTGVIGVNAAREDTQKRFTVAHEIGHFLIHHSRKPAIVCETGLSQCFSPGLDPAEVDANEFAAELLLPAKLMLRRFDLGKPSLSRIAAVAKEFETSLGVTTRRFLTLTKEPCAMIWSTQGKAVWYSASRSLKGEVQLRDLPAAASSAGRLFAGRRAPPGMQPVDPHMWFSSSRAVRVRTLFEESVMVPGEAAVLTLLWAGLREEGGAAGRTGVAPLRAGGLLY